MKLNSGHDILEAVRHNDMPGLLPGSTRKDIEQLPFFFFFFLRDRNANVLCILEAISNNYIAGLLPGRTRDDIGTTA